MKNNIDSFPRFRYGCFMNRKELALKIKLSLENIRHQQGWTLDDLANYLEINSLTLRNCLSTMKWSDLVVTILKLKNVIKADLANDYKRSLEREKIERRKKNIKEIQNETHGNHGGRVRKIF